MTDAHCHVSCGDLSVRELLIGRDFFGVHPWETLDGTTGANALLVPDVPVVPDVPFPAALQASLRARLLENPKVGVGEIGLDRLKVRDISPRMREVFEAQLALAIELGRPVVLHGAKCWGQVVAAVKALSACAAKSLVLPLTAGAFAATHPSSDRFRGSLCSGDMLVLSRSKAALVQGAEAPGTRFLFHGFSRSDGLIPEIVKLNGFISVGPAVLNDHAVNYRELVKKIPLDRLLVETDRTASASPHVAMSQDSSASSSISIFDVLAKTADILNISAAELERITDENADRFLGVV